ncbi:MAG: GC-type dockerin domain-anchored protein, partial [Planctomycetota bacterium]
QDECGPVRVSTDPNGPINRDGYIPPGVYEVDIDVGAALSNFFGTEAAETAELFFYDGGWFPPDCLNLDRDGIGVFLLDAADVCAWFRSPTDTNADGAINDLDRQWLEYMVENQDFPPAVLFADVNGDWSLTPADFNAWIAAFNAGSQRADQNGDQLITPSDFNAWILNYNSQACGADV